MFKPAVKMSRQEKSALVLNHATPEEFDRLRNVLSTATDDQLDALVRSAQAVAAKNVAELQMKTAQAKLLLAQNGVLNTDQNWLILQSHLGDYYTFEKAHELVRSNAAVRTGLIWRQGVTPFGEHNRAVAEQQEADAREQAEERAEQQAFAAKEEQAFQLFVAAAKETTIRGISVAPNRANWSLVRQALPLGELPTIQNIVRVLMAGNLNIAPNDVDAVQAQAREDIFRSIRPRLIGDPTSEKVRVLCKTLPIVQLRDRIRLAGEIADNYSRSPQACDEEFRKQMVSVSPNHDLQARVGQIRENKRLRSLAPGQLKAEAAAQRQQPQQSQGFPVLGPEFSGPELVKMCGDKDKIRHMIKHYGREQIDRRLAEYQRALKSTGWSHRIATEEVERFKE